MNVSTIGFPFPGAAGAPALGTPEQAFVLALGAAGFGAPTGAGAANDGIARAANDAASDKVPTVRIQPAPAMTLAQLMATGSKVPATVSAIAPAQLTADTETQLPAGSTAQPAANSVPELLGDAIAQKPGELASPATTATPPLADKAGSVAPTTPPAAAQDPALPNPVTPAQGSTTAVPCPSAADEAPKLPDLPTAERPTSGVVATPTVATPVKARKPLVVDRDAQLLPVDPLAAQPVAMVPVAVVPAAPVAQPMTPATSAERKADGARGGKTISIASAQAEAPAADGAKLPETKLGEASEARSNEASLSDAALPKEIAAKTEGRAAAPAQSFAAHVTAPAPASHAAPQAAAPAAAEPMVPARAGQLGHALGVEIARKVDAGEDTLRVRLNPVELGRVEVTLAFDDRGNLRATMRAESQHALDLLRQDAPDLGRALDSAGIRADSQSFRFENRGDGNGGSAGGGQAGQQQSRGNSQHAFNDEPETPAPAYRAIRNDGQVDLLA